MLNYRDSMRLYIITLYNYLLVNFLFGYVSPVYHSGAEYEIDGRGRFRAVDDGRHLVMIQRYLPYVVLHRE